MQVNCILPWCKNTVEVYAEISMFKEHISSGIQDFIFYSSTEITYCRLKHKLQVIY